MSSSPAKKRQHRKRQQETLEVVCRIKRSTNPDPHPCVIAIDDEYVQLIQPNTHIDRLYRFAYVFDVQDDQRFVFERACLDFVGDLLKGRNSLLFAYGVTGSGKTYTLTGRAIGDKMGILPRASDVLFNSLPELAHKCVFQPDGRNGFSIRSDLDAFEARRQLPAVEYEAISQQHQRVKDTRSVRGFHHGMAASVFVSYVEIYNDLCYDLLDESLSSSESRANMSKRLVTDQWGQVYVERITEVEVASSDEILEQYLKAQERRKMAATMLNANSSRSHSVFNIRLVMAPSVMREERDERIRPVDDASKVVVSQLSLVDLAGSERTKRTQNDGNRLAEAGKINQSLSCLRRCFDQLRENQRKGSPCVPVSYRDSKVTHLFKNYFEGNGRIRMIVCVNPEPAEYDENVFVMGFAELAQTVDIPEAAAPRLPLAELANLHYPRRDIDRWYREMEAIVAKAAPRIDVLGKRPPPFIIEDSDDSTAIRRLREFYQQRLADHRGLLATTQSNGSLLTNKLKQRVCVADLDRRRVDELEGELNELNNYNAELNAKKNQLERERNALQSRLYRYESVDDANKRKEAEERANHKEYATALEKGRKTMMKIADIMETPVLPFTQERLVPSTSKVASLRKQFGGSAESVNGNGTSGKQQPQRQKTGQSPGSSARPSRVQPINSQGFVNNAPTVFYSRRSRSVNNIKVLNHQPVNKIPMGTVMQPKLPRNTKYTTLVEVEQLQKCDAYMVTRQQVDEKGNLMTDLVKGEIVPTAGGGSAVILNDKECLHQERMDD